MNMWINKIPRQGKRVLMLTPDVMIDRRILIEAETLIDEGYEVYLLAGWDDKIESIYEMNGRVKVERIKYEGIDEGFLGLYKFQNQLISLLNLVSIKSNNLFASKAKSNNLFHSKANRIYLHLYLLLINDYYFFIVVKLISKLKLLLIKVKNLAVNLLIKVKNLAVNLIAKSINLSTRLIPKIISLLFQTSAYEYLLLKRGLFYRPDIVHVHDLPMLKVGTKLKQRLSIPLIYDMHEFYPEQDCLTAYQKNTLRNTEEKNIRLSDVCITVNPMLAQEISQTYKNISPIQVIQNAMIIEPDFHQQSYDRFRQEYGISSDEIILLYQGWISPHRNLQNLVVGLKDVHYPIKLILMGYGDFQFEIQKIAKDLGVENKIIFVPTKSQNELLSYTASADLGIIPYPFRLDPNTKYASPNKLYEFIASRLPIICNNLPFVKSVVEDNGFGLAFEMDSPESFSKALNEFPYEKIQFFKSNLEKNGTNYLWEAEAPKLLEIYQNIFADHT